MRSEVSAAANWWSEKLRDAAPHFSAEKVELFNVSLKIAMFRKFGAHWYEEEPVKGQAYRSLMITRSFVDSLLLEAAEKAKIGCIGNLLHNICRDATMWVDPRTVEVRLEGVSGKSHSAVIFRGYVPPPVQHMQPLQTRNTNRPSTLFVPSKEQQIQQLRMHGRLSENYFDAEMSMNQQLEQYDYFPTNGYATPAEAAPFVEQQENYIPVSRQSIHEHYHSHYAPSSQSRMTAAAPIYQPRPLSFGYEQARSCASEYHQRQDTRAFHTNRTIPAYR